MSTLDICIRTVADKVAPGSSLEERFKLRRAINELVQNQKNGFGRPLNTFHANLLAQVNAQYQKEIRRELIKNIICNDGNDLSF